MTSHPANRRLQRVVVSGLLVVIAASLATAAWGRAGAVIALGFSTLWFLWIAAAPKDTSPGDKR